jgi:hypothetical protein
MSPCRSSTALLTEVINYPFAAGFYKFDCGAKFRANRAGLGNDLPAVVCFKLPGTWIMNDSLLVRLSKVNPDAVDLG